MTVKITKEAKKWLTVAQMPTVKRMIEQEKENGMPEKELAAMAASVILGSKPEKVFEVSAEIAGNDRISNYYTDDSGNLDIWVNFSAFSTFDGFVTGGAYLSDIYQLGTPDINEQLKKHMYFILYKPQ